MNRYEQDMYKDMGRLAKALQNYIGAWDNLPQKLMNDYRVKANDCRIIRQRINDRKINKKNNTI